MEKSQQLNEGAYIAILGSGMAVPCQVVSNKMLEKSMDTSEAFIVERTGILERRYVSENEDNSDLMSRAILKAVEDASINTNDIDMVIACTLSPDFHDPSQACLLHGKLPFRNIPVFDIRAQCSGFLYALFLAEKIIKSTPSSKILIACGEVLSRRVKGNISDRNIAVLLGDGAGAVVVGKSTNPTNGLVDIEINADGKYYDLLKSESPGTANDFFIEPKDLADGRNLFKMQGRELFEHATKTIISEIKRKLSKHSLTIENITKVICHQPNVRMLEYIADNLGLKKNQLHVNASYYGNMGSASVVVAWAECSKSALSGDIFLIIGYGAGSTWGSALYFH